MKDGTRISVFPQILILTAIAVFGGGGGVDLPKAVKKSVGDDARREQAVAASERMLAARERAAVGMGAIRVDLYAALRNDPMEAQQLEEILVRIDALLDTQRADYVEASMALRDAMTRDEWAKLQKKLD